MTSCPFETKSKPCPEAEAYAGPTPQKLGTAYCPLHGRFAVGTPEPAPEAEAVETPAAGATVTGAPPTGQETATRGHAAATEIVGGGKKA